MMRRRELLLAGLGVGCAVPARAAEAEVVIDNFVFTPPDLAVAPGTRVTWRNRDDIPHSIVSAAGPPLFRSPALDTDESFTHVFDMPGSYPYFCGLHPHMTGKVTVR
jgi:plastocyanin